MEQLSSLLNHCVIPQPNDKVYKDECAYCFESPESQRGLYLCMRTFLSLCRDHVEEHSVRTGQKLYLHHVRLRRKVETPTDEADGNPAAIKKTRMAIGVEGGFDSGEPKFTVDEQNAVTVLPGFSPIPLPETELPLVVAECVTQLLAADSVARQEDAAAAAAAGVWDGEMRVESAHALSLQQLDNGVKIPPSGWKCSRCDLTSNLWLNLTDGAILCGRRFFDGTGGNNHAVDYYKEKSYPLAVKLGTITVSETGVTADVFSYPEDDMVIDPLLVAHLQHFGINVQAMEKTERTMAELEVALNEKYGEWNAMQESDCQLQELSGPGLTGIRNLGNSCYIASVMQTLFTIPDFVEKYAAPGVAESFFTAAGNDPVNHFNAQMAKFGRALVSTPPLVVDDNDDVIRPKGVRPQMFKSLVGRGHPEFSSKRQQDAQEFLLHLFSLIERNSVGASNPTDTFKFQIEDRLQCGSSGKVRYTNRDEFCLSLPVAMDAVTNGAEVAAYAESRQAAAAAGQEEPPLVRPKVSLAACLQAFAAEEVVQDFASPAADPPGSKTTANKRVRMATFPDHIVVQMRRFTLGEDWTPKKLDVEVEVPDEVDIEWLRGKGCQAGEEELPQEASTATVASVPVPDAAMVSQLVDMGFPRPACEKAVHLTGNSGVEAAMNWIMEHMDDPDFAVPLPELQGPQTPSAQPQVQVSDEALAMVESMGFPKEHALRALRATQGSAERAVDWIFSHMDELNQPEAPAPAPAAAAPPAPAATGRDGPGRYSLLGFISHMGPSTSSGHYVCHLKKAGRWVIFNDEKVAASEKAPRALAYLYFFRRADLPPL